MLEQGFRFTWPLCELVRKRAGDSGKLQGAASYDVWERERQT